jgi:hypothetical protein
MCKSVGRATPSRLWFFGYTKGVVARQLVERKQYDFSALAWQRCEMN